MRVGDNVSNELDFFNFVPPGPVSQDFYNNFRLSNPIKNCGIMGPVGSAKTMLCLATEFVRAYHHIPPHPQDNVIRSRLLVLREDYRVMDETVIKSFKELTRKYEEAGFVKWKKEDPKEAVLSAVINEDTENELRFELEFIFLAITDQKTPEQVFRGWEYSNLFCNELMVPQEYWEFAKTRLGRYPSLPPHLKEKQKAFAICDFNAPNGNDWQADAFLFQVKPNTKLWRQPGGMEAGAENIENLPKNYYIDLKNEFSNTNQINRFIHNKLGNREDISAVFPDYSDSYHCGQVLNAIPNVPIMLAADAGLNPAVLIAQEDGFGQCRVLMELVDFDISVEKFAPKLKNLLLQHFNGYEVLFAVVDPAASAKNANASEAESWMNLMSRHSGIRFKQAYTNSWNTRKSSVDALLTRNISGGIPAFALSTQCQYLRKALGGGYHYPQKKNQAGKFSDDPLKNEYSHVADALQYLALELGYAKPQGDMFKKASKTLNIKTWAANAR